MLYLTLALLVALLLVEALAARSGSGLVENLGAGFQGGQRQGTGFEKGTGFLYGNHGSVALLRCVMRLNPFDSFEWFFLYLALGTSAT